MGVGLMNPPRGVGRLEAPGIPNWAHTGKEYCYTIKNHSNETMRDYLRHRKPLTGPVGS